MQKITLVQRTDNIKRATTDEHQRAGNRFHLYRNRRQRRAGKVKPCKTAWKQSIEFQHTDKGACGRRHQAAAVLAPPDDCFGVLYVAMILREKAPGLLARIGWYVRRSVHDLVRLVT